jgi:hypothetical protein
MARAREELANSNCDRSHRVRADRTQRCGVCCSFQRLASKCSAIDATAGSA